MTESCSSDFESADEIKKMNTYRKAHKGTEGQTRQRVQKS